MHTRFSQSFLVTVLMTALCAACGDDGSGGSNPDAPPATSPDANQASDAAAADATPESDAGPTADASGSQNLCAPSAVRCEDDLFLDLSLHDDRVSQGNIVNTQDGDDWVSVADATAGGAMQASQNAFLYMRFEDSGLVKVDIDDQTALTSSDWHIAARRFIIRLNSGVSGSSCVGAAMFPGTSYADLTEVPVETQFLTEQFYNDSCTLVEDNSGLPGTPNVALTGWWGYTGCVTTTGTPALIQLNDGRFVRLVVETYYGVGQDICNAEGTPGSMSGMLTFRWQFLP